MCIRDRVGTLAYMAPEQRRGRNELKSDVYTSAAVLVETLTLKPPPKSGLNIQDTMDRLSLVPFPKESDSKQKSAFLTHLQACFETAPENRPSAKEALKHASMLHSSLYKSTFVVGSP